MTLKELDNLVKSKKMKVEPPDQEEFDGLIELAKSRLSDSQVEGVSEEGQFTSAYGAAHALALAAVRWHGYRSENRVLVFQSLVHTVGMDSAKWRLLDKCHKQRNLAEYEGHLEVTPQLLGELVKVTAELLELVMALEPIK